MLKIKLKEADYKSIHKILNDTSIYNDLSIDNVNYIISEISDNLYNINNKLELIETIGKCIGIENISDDIAAITESINSVFDSALWINVISKFEELD
jgi:hypothetical protein